MEKLLVFRKCGLYRYFKWRNGCITDGHMNVLGVFGVAWRSRKTVTLIFILDGVKGINMCGHFVLWGGQTDRQT